MIKLARKYHKWFMAFLGVQFLFWSITGLYMVSMDIHHIHGEGLQKPSSEVLELGKVTYPIASLSQRYPTAENISIVKLLSRQVYQFDVTAPHKKWLLIDANSGQLMPEIEQEVAVNIARYHYSKEHNIADVILIDSKIFLPSELSARYLPVWQVTFEHFSSPTFYISQQTGQIVTKRHNYWRLFDWMWRFHIMDYDDGENVSNWFLLLVALLGGFSALAGGILSYFRIVKPNYGVRK